MFLESIFAASTAAIVHHHLAYPVLLKRLPSRVDGPAAASAADRPAITLPKVTLIVPAYQEEAFIAGKITNIAALSYPRDRLQVRIVCDGCTDRTVAAAQAAIADPALNGLDIAVVAHPFNRGKVAILNEAIAIASGDLVCLSDASADLQADTLERLAAHFADPAVGAACGRYELADPGSAGEAAYWRYQTAIKQQEGRLGSPMGMHGACYLFRRVLWEPLEADTINDDFILPMRIVAQGYRGVYDATVATFERERTRPDQEFRRRTRIAAGNVQQALRLPELADPGHPGLAFVFLSGKWLRAFVPFLFVAALLSSLMLAADGSSVFAAIAALQLVGYILVALILATRGLAWPRPLRWGAYLVEGHVAGLIGGSRYLLGLERGQWGRAAGAEEAGRGNFVPASTRVFKRLTDIAIALVVLAVFAVTFPFIAIAIRLDSKGPLFYRQLRVGEATPRFTRLFHMIKYRTMRVDAEARSGAMWATDNDPRITRVGRFLRKTRLDELPQCLNVLAGDMSIIGPRPERPSFFKTLETAIPFYAERTYGLRPGISGLAQVNQGYDTSIEDVRSKVLHDHAYAMRLTTPMGWLRADLEVVFRTLWVMITGRGQ